MFKLLELLNFNIPGGAYITGGRNLFRIPFHRTTSVPYLECNEANQASDWKHRYSFIVR